MKHLLLLSLLALLGACGSTPDTPPAPVEDRTRGAQTAVAQSSGSDSTTVQSSALNANAATTLPLATVSSNPSGSASAYPQLRDPASPLSKRTVLFDYDSFVVRDEYKSLLEAHARFLAANRALRLRVNGHTDERGTREYNLALGQKRADAIRRMFTLLGASEAQVEGVSFGEEKPADSDASESAWAKNRRGELTYQGE